MIKIYYALKPPNGTKAYDFWLLKQASKARKFYMGTYYIPSKKLYVPVFKRIGGADPRAFLEVKPSELRSAFKMVCIEGCGQCCERNSNARIMESEVEQLGIELRNKPSYTLKLIDGTEEKIYRLDTRKGGQCAFYNPSRKRCVLGKKKPILCLIHYCTAFAERVEGGRKRKYVKVSSKFLPEGRVEMVFEPVSEEEWEEIKKMVRRGTNVWRAVAEILRRRNLPKAES
ncbi:hypothetical protein IPA_06565 [Ignicoccus pacificus DSM 13166]|uniref:YkgJ family cysteine cluster protein n=1 Tax=Ignicoccus pacificus DSM 13166 TaxID=940294 RepID=A0A977KBG4_9CREN|nr:hypothetical protein IPA_06565 [Ignicoccus pacificus DSM 13166]